MEDTQVPECNGSGLQQYLYIAFELGNTNWVLGFSNGKKIRYRTIPARSMVDFFYEMKLAIVKLGLPNDVQIVSCYEAGRDGFWLDRVLEESKIQNLVVDSSSIEVNRKARKQKTDRMDANKLVRMLIRYINGEEQVWSVLRIPSSKIEDERRLHREIERLQKEQTAHTNRIRSLLCIHGIVLDRIETSPQWLSNCKTKDDQPLGEGLRGELARELKRLQIVREQLKEVQLEKSKILKEGQSESVEKSRKLLKIRGIGPVSSWNLVFEFFWRDFDNRKQVAAAAGLVPSQYQSGKMDKDLGINKEGNRRVRSLMVEISWLWLRYQPQSNISKWYQQRFGSGGSKRMKKVGIVALARKLLVALWKYLEKDIVPEGALIVE